MEPQSIASISFSAPLGEAIRSGRKTVTRRRFAGCVQLLEEPDHYYLHRLDTDGAHFIEVATGRRLPVLRHPFGLPGEMLLQLAEAPELRLQVTATRVERVQAITAAGALAEGVRSRAVAPGLTDDPARWGGVEPDPAGGFCWYNDPIMAFAQLLSSFYPLAWERNAWVWVIEFRLLEP